MTPRLATAILLLALSACECETAPGQRVVTAVSRERAEAVYLQKCAICHGERGDGQGPRRGSLFKKPPDFRQVAWREGKSLEQVRSVIRDGRPGSDMPAWKSLDDAEIAGLAKYVLGFADASGSRTEAGSR